MLLNLPCDIDDRFTLVAELGHGSHAIVYRATDRSLGREVAIKVLRSELIDSVVSERFRREIRLTSQLEHPNIAHVYDTGEFMGAPYFVTAIARGASLAERLSRERQLPVDEALSIARQIASALGHAHGAGIIHRDVKPANILLTPDGALLTDFGVARALERTPGTLATSTGVAVGTLLYMSPEQLCAEKGIDGRSDQYSLALVLYEMLAGVPPHVAANAEGLRALRVAGQHVPIRTLRPSVPEAVDAAIHTALCSTPADRHRSVLTFSASLDALAPRIETPRWRGSHETFLTARRALRRRQWLLSAGVTLGIASIGAFGAFHSLSSKTERPLANDASVRAFTVVPTGDITHSAPLAEALVAELGEWPAVHAVLGGGGLSGPQLAVRVSAIGGRLHATVAPRDASGAFHTARVSFPANAPLDGDSLRLLAARVIMASIVSLDSADTPDVIVSRVTPAVLSYARAWKALLSGELAQAHELFADAARTGAVPQAVLWQANVASWSAPMKPQVWRAAAQRALLNATHFSTRDSLIASGLYARANNGMDTACDAYSHATKLDGGAFAAWYGLAECLRIDSAVVEDLHSPTGARFRTSYWSAMRAYQEAVLRLPSAGLADLFSRLQDGARSLSATQRVGWRAAGHEPLYAGIATATGDSVEIFPMPLRRLASGDASTVPRSFQEATRRNRERLREIFAALATRAPSSVVAALGYTRALEYSGALDSPSPQPSALSQLARARALLRTKHDTLDAALAEMRVRLRLSDFAGTRRVANRVLELAPSASADDAERLVPVAVLINRAAAAESLLITAHSLEGNPAGAVSRDLARRHAAYVLSAAVGDCRALAAKRRDLVNAIRSEIAAAEVPAAVERFVGSGDWMGMTCVGAPAPEQSVASAPILLAIEALNHGDARRARNIVVTTEARRAGAASSAITWDTRFREIWVLVQSKDTAAAESRIAGTFANLKATMDYVLFDIPQSAALRQFIALCSNLGAAHPGAAYGAVCTDAQKNLISEP